MGEGDTVLVLSQERADAYLKTGQAMPLAERVEAQITLAGGTGGLWLPKPGIRKEARLFYEVRNAKNVSGLGVLPAAVIPALTEGTLNFVPFGTEEQFLSGLHVISP